MARTPEKPASFEAAMSELERIVAAMESPDQALDQTLAQYERGIRLARFCEETLREAEQKIRVLEGGELKPFEGGSSEDTPTP